MSLSSTINININFDNEDCGYKELTSKRVYNFVLNNLKNGNNLINSQKNTFFNIHGDTKLKLKAIKHTKWKYANTWDNIKCKFMNESIKTVPCTIGSKRAKIYYKLEGNKKIAGFALYLMALNINAITLEKHKEFIKACKKIFKNKDLYIDNLDVQWMHILSKKV